MAKSLEDQLYEAIIKDDRDAVAFFLSQDANPNKIVNHGKTCLGEAAHKGNLCILRLLVDATQSSTSSSQSNNINSKKRSIKSQKRKHKLDIKHDETVIKYKNVNERLIKNQSEFSESVKPQSTQEKNQGYFVLIHNEASGSHESRISRKLPPLSPSHPSALTPSPQADLEWDEEIGNTAPTTSEDERWCSIYQWYAAILESTGAAIASASPATYGIDQQDAYTRTALHYAVHQGHFEAVKLLLEAGCKIDVTAGDGLTPLHVGVIKNHVEIVETLLNFGSQVNYKTHDKMTTLHLAASRGYLNVVKILVNNGAYLEARDTSERTALYVAAGRGHAEVVEYLISFGANVNGEEIHGYTPLCEAVWQKYESVVKILLSSGARVTHSHKLLHDAVIQKQEEIVRLLASHGGAINLHNDNGDTPLLLAARLTLPGIAKILLDCGANVNATNNITGASALHIAVESKGTYKELEELMICLFENKMDMNIVALTGDTALNRALLLSRDYPAILLIRYGANVNASDLHSWGLDNLSIASKRENFGLASLLMKAGHYTSVPGPDEPIPKAGTAANCLYFACKQPFSLSDLCRIQIRKNSKGRVLCKFVSNLPLPKKLKRFIMLEDL